MSGLTRKPRVGERLTYQGQPYGVVHHFDGNLCWVQRPNDPADRPSGLFIWRFGGGRPLKGGDFIPETFNVLFEIAEDLNTKVESPSEVQTTPK